MENSFEDALKIAQNVVIPKANDVIPAFFQCRRTLAVRRDPRTVLTAINLDNQVPIQGDEVDIESCNRNLPFEFDAVELTRSKSRPKETLGVGRIPTELTGVLSQRLSPLTLPSPLRGEGHFT